MYASDIVNGVFSEAAHWGRDDSYEIKLRSGSVNFSIDVSYRSAGIAPDEELVLASELDEANDKIGHLESEIDELKNEIARLKVEISNYDE